MEKRLAIAKEVIDMAYSMDMWIFGGYVRDVVVRRQKKFGDLDICCSRDTTDVSQFIRMLGTRYDVTSHDVRTFEHTYGSMSPGIRKLHKCSVRVGDVHMRVDVVVYDDSFREWCKEHTVDFSCNLFYMKRDVALGIRYVPDFLKHDPSPMTKLIEMSCAYEFQRIWDVPRTTRPQWINVIRIHDRAKELIKRGWYMPSTPTLMSELMSLEIGNKPYAQEECERTMRIIENVQSGRAIKLLERYTGRSSVTTTIKNNICM